MKINSCFKNSIKKFIIRKKPRKFPPAAVNQTISNYTYLLGDELLSLLSFFLSSFLLRSRLCDCLSAGADC